MKDEEMLENEFEAKIIKMFDDRYHSDVKPEMLDKAEQNEKYWQYFKEYLHDVACEIYNPIFEGTYIRLLFRDYIYYNGLFEEEKNE